MDAGTELACRSFIRVADTPAFGALVDQQIDSWVRRKRWTEADLKTANPTQVADGVIGTLVREENRDGSINTRHRWVQTGPQGRWVTEITQHRDQGGITGWVWTDLHAPIGGRTSIPRIAKDIVSVVRGLDGAHPITQEPTRARIDRVDEVYRALTDDKRRGYLYLAGTNSGVPYEAWATYVGKMLRDTIGLASAYILDSDATEELNARLPPSHQVLPATVRTFHPDVDLTDPTDSLAHRVLGTDRIVRDDANYLRRLLSRRAYDLSVERPLPHDAERIDRRLRELLDDVVAFDAPTPQATTVVVPKQPTTPIAIPEVNEPEQTPDVANIRVRLQVLEDERANEKRRAERLHLELQDERLEHALALERYQDVERQLRKLYGELARTGSSDIDYSPAERIGLDAPPDDFDDLLRRVVDLDRVKFTGDGDLTRALTEHNDGYAWVWKTWDALRALNDYARASSNGFNGGVMQYLDNTPPGMVGYSKNNFAAVESESVRSVPRFRAARIFPVPTSVDSNGEIFMEAHFKLVTARSVSPRLHFYDDTANSGLIYVGYIGRHLDNLQTN